ncbi:MAG: SMC-Scp complex subunit ScpB, partial [Thermoanaerobaculia bacterium]
KKVVGKPFLYRTTREFLMHFGLGSLDDLPPLEEFEEIFGPDGVDLGGRTEERQQDIFEESFSVIESLESDES